METDLTIHEVAARTGLSVHTLRYYERIGLVHPVDRATNGHRRYTRDDLTWVAFLQCLRATGMSIRHMRTFADLARQGDVTAPERLALLEVHQRHVREQVHQLEGYLALVEAKAQRVRNRLADEMTSAERDGALTAHPASVPMERMEGKEEEIAPSPAG